MRGVPGTKYIVKHGSEYVINRVIDGKLKYFGRGATLIITLVKRDWVEANDWKPYYAKEHEIKAKLSLKEAREYE